MTNEEERLSLKEKLGYGVASVGDTMLYNILTVYALFFLTDVANLAPAAAGAVIFAATLWNAVSVAIIGHVSDRYSFRLGRRIPYMFSAILPMMVFLVLMFTTVSFPPALQALYYVVVMAVLWSAHSTFMVPYEALGAELTDDPNERTLLRSYARFFMGIGNLFALVLFLYTVESLQRSGMESGLAWQLTVAGMAVIAGVTFWITVTSLKDRGLQNAQKEAESRKPAPKLSMLRSYLQVLRLKPFIYVILSTFFLTVANVFCSSNVVYFMKYNLGLTEAYKPLVFLIITATGLMTTPLFVMGAYRFGKKSMMVVSYSFSGLLLAALYLLGIRTLVVLCLTVAIYTIGTSAYWQLSYSMCYDVGEVNAAVNGDRSGGVVMSLTKIFFKISSAVAAQAFALVLQLTGYNANAQAQSGQALWGISVSLTIIPAVFFILAAVVVFYYPLSEKQRNK